jgi:hypothetical protein
MGRVNGRDISYVFPSKVHYYIIGAHLLCTNYMDSFFIEVENLKSSPNCAYKWFYGTLIDYTLKKIAAIIACIHPSTIKKHGSCFPHH